MHWNVTRERNKGSLHWKLKTITWRNQLESTPARTRKTVVPCAFQHQRNGSPNSRSFEDCSEGVEKCEQELELPVAQITGLASQILYLRERLEKLADSVLNCQDLEGTPEGIAASDGFDRRLCSLDLTLKNLAGRIAALQANITQSIERQTRATAP